MADGDFHANLPSEVMETLLECEGIPVARVVHASQGPLLLLKEFSFRTNRSLAVSAARIRRAWMRSMGLVDFEDQISRVVPVVLLEQPYCEANLRYLAALVEAQVLPRCHFQDMRLRASIASARLRQMEWLGSLAGLSINPSDYVHPEALALTRFMEEIDDIPRPPSVQPTCLDRESYDRYFQRILEGISLEDYHLRRVVRRFYRQHAVILYRPEYSPHRSNPARDLRMFVLRHSGFVPYRTFQSMLRSLVRSYGVDEGVRLLQALVPLFAFENVPAGLCSVHAHLIFQSSPRPQLIARFICPCCGNVEQSSQFRWNDDQTIVEAKLSCPYSNLWVRLHGFDTRQFVRNLALLRLVP